MSHVRTQMITLLSCIGKKSAKMFENHIYETLFPAAEEDEDGIELYRNLMYNFLHTFQTAEEDSKISVFHSVMDCTARAQLEKAVFANHEELAENQRMRDDFITKPMEVEEGVEPCPRCGCKKSYSYQKQVRSGDEGMSTFCTCANPKCRHRWYISG